MKKSALVILLCILVFYIGYSQTQSAQQRKISLEAMDEIVIKTGDASITMKKDGSIVLKGKNIQIEGANGVNVKASGDIILKGKKIGEN